MKKLSEYENEEALELLADTLVPITRISADEEFVKKFRSGNVMLAIQYVLKNHKNDVLTILARLEGVPLEEYKCNIFTLPLVLIKLINDPELMDFFASQGLKINVESFGSAMVNTEEEPSADSSNM